jgi:hypothetical protein
MPWKADTDCRDISGTRRQPEIVDETGRVIADIRESKAIYTAAGDLDEAAMAAAEDRTARFPGTGRPHFGGILWPRGDGS